MSEVVRLGVIVFVLSVSVRTSDPHAVQGRGLISEPTGEEIKVCSVIIATAIVQSDNNELCSNLILHRSHSSIPDRG